MISHGMIDEGVIKYRQDWTRTGPLPEQDLAALAACRDRLFEAGLIGHDAEHDVGYGNVSVRAGDAGQFIISGSQTGHLMQTGPEHYARVTGYDIDANRVDCEGPVAASSEALTHAAIYELDPTIGAVVHVHNRGLWAKLRDRLPTTAAKISYGTPAMAREFRRLYRDTYLKAHGVAVMGGHADGLIAFGRDIEQAEKRILAL